MGERRAARHTVGRRRRQRRRRQRETATVAAARRQQGRGEPSAVRRLRRRRKSGADGGRVQRQRRQLRREGVAMVAETFGRAGDLSEIDVRTGKLHDWRLQATGFGQDVFDPGVQVHRRTDADRDRRETREIQMQPNEK